MAYIGSINNQKKKILAFAGWELSGRRYSGHTGKIGMLHLNHCKAVKITRRRNYNMSNVVTRIQNQTI